MLLYSHFSEAISSSSSRFHSINSFYTSESKNREGIRSLFENTHTCIWNISCETNDILSLLIRRFLCSTYLYPFQRIETHQNNTHHLDSRPPSQSLRPIRLRLRPKSQCAWYNRSDSSVLTPYVPYHARRCRWRAWHSNPRRLIRSIRRPTRSR